MDTKKQKYRRLARMTIAFVCCFPVFMVMNVILEDAPDALVFFINLVIGGTILFITYLIGSKKDEIRQKLHEEHLREIEERKHKGYIDKTQIDINEEKGENK